MALEVPANSMILKARETGEQEEGSQYLEGNALLKLRLQVTDITKRVAYIAADWASDTIYHKFIWVVQAFLWSWAD